MYTYEQLYPKKWMVKNPKGRVIAYTLTEQTAMRVAKGLRLEREHQQKIDNFKL